MTVLIFNKFQITDRITFAIILKNPLLPKITKIGPIVNLHNLHQFQHLIDLLVVCPADIIPHKIPHRL